MIIVSSSNNNDFNYLLLKTNSYSFSKMIFGHSGPMFTFVAGDKPALPTRRYSVEFVGKE